MYIIMVEKETMSFFVPISSPPLQMRVKPCTTQKRLWRRPLQRYFYSPETLSPSRIRLLRAQRAVKKC